MEPILLAKIAIRVVALYLVAQGLVYLPTIASIFDPPPADEARISMLVIALVTLLPLVVGIALWMLAPILARLAVGERVEIPVAPAATLREVQAVAIATVGLVLLFDVLPVFISSTYHTVVMAPQLEGERFFRADQITHLIGLGLQMVFSLALILGAKFWVRLLWSIRRIGLRKDERL